MSHPTYRFIVIERDVFVARDMSDGFIAACADCEVVHLRFPSELTPDIARHPQHRTVIVTKMSVQEVEECGLTEMARRHDAEIVIRAGDDPITDVLRMGWRSLTSPFTREDLFDLVGSLRPLARQAG